MKAVRIKSWKSPRSPAWEMYQNPSRFVCWYFYRRLDEALRLAGIRKEHTVLDLGCWMGYFLPTLSRYSRRVIGLDTADEICSPPAWDKRVEGWDSMDIAKELITVEVGRLNNINLIKADGCRMPLSNSSIDIIFCLDAMEHVSDVDDLLQECARVLRTGGVFVATMPNELGWALVLRQIFSMLVGVRRDKYSIKELTYSVVTGKPPESSGRSLGSHKGYDFRGDIERIRKYFSPLKVVRVPLGFALGLNPTVVVKGVKVN